MLLCRCPYHVTVERLGGRWSEGQPRKLLRGHGTIDASGVPVLSIDAGERVRLRLRGKIGLLVDIERQISTGFEGLIDFRSKEARKGSASSSSTAPAGSPPHFRPLFTLRLVSAALCRGQPSVAVFGETTLAALAAAQTSASRFTTWILGLFASAAMVLSAIGIYGVMSYVVTQRTQEFGIRLALGADAHECRVVGPAPAGALLIALGTAIGVAIVAGLSRVFTSLLFEVTPLDGVSGLAILVLVMVAVLACFVPAVRARRSIR